MLTTRNSRRLAAGASIGVLCLAAVLGARGVQEPWLPEAPAYRQKGSPQARVVLVEYSDFQCPGCAATVETVKRLHGVYGDRLRIVFKHLPWENIHPWAKDAAAAAECAGGQGKFWELHDILFLKQAEWARHEDAGSLIRGYARSIGVKPGPFTECLRNPETAAAVAGDQREAEERWIHSTPTFFINGKRFAGLGQLRTAGLKEIARLLPE